MGRIFKKNWDTVRRNFIKEVFSGKYYLPLNIDEHIKGTMEIIQKVVDKLNSVELSISISTEDYTRNQKSKEAIY